MMSRSERPGRRHRHADPESRRRAFAAQLYREELGRHWSPRGLTRADRVQVMRRTDEEWGRR
jgi:hypothetical protein